jgi:exopolysaccharide production protein ExoZ
MTRVVVDQRATLYNVHILRGAAAMMVVLLHASEQFTQGLMLFPANFGNAGVDIFFVISGFVMVHSSARRPRGPAEFFRDRLLRIAPMYWLFTSLTVMASLVAPSAFRGTVFEPVHAFLSYLFVAYPHPVNHGSLSPILRVGWTLNYEMFFYLIFALALAIRPNAKVTIVLVILSALVLMRPLFRGGDIALFYTRDIVLEFGIGMLIATAYGNGILARMSALFGLVLLIAGLGTLFAIGREIGSEHPLRFLWFGLPAGAIIIGAIVLESHKIVRARWFVQLLGDASYVIYLSHPFVLTGMRLAYDRMGFAGDTLLGNSAAVFIMCICAMTVGIICHLLVEIPVSAWLRKTLSGGTSPNGV